MIGVSLLLAAQAATAAPAPSQAGDIAIVAALLAEVEKGIAKLDGIRFEGLEDNEAVASEDFVAFARKCPLEQLNVVPSSPIRQPVFVSWDCRNYAHDTTKQQSDNRKAAVFLDGQAINLIKFGVPEVITVGGAKARTEKPGG